MKSLWLTLSLVALAGCTRAPGGTADAWKPEGRVAARARVAPCVAHIGEPIHYTIDARLGARGRPDDPGRAGGSRLLRRHGEPRDAGGADARRPGTAGRATPSSRSSRRGST